MDFFIISSSICFVGLAIGSYTDLRTREVPDWLNYSLIFSGLGLRLIFSVQHWDYKYILDGILGFGLFFIFALFMFYTGQWGGGDSKMLIGLGALIGLPFTLQSMLLGFLVNLLFVGSVYGLFWMVWKIFAYNREFRNEFRSIQKGIMVRRSKTYSLVGGAAFLIIGFFIVSTALKILLFTLAMLIPSIVYLWIAIKAIEKVCMIKMIDVGKLTEGDWIVDDIKIGKKNICGPKDLGISKEQINKLKKSNIKKVKVKEGIPFVPSFFLSFIVTILFGNLAFYFLAIAG